MAADYSVMPIASSRTITSEGGEVTTEIVCPFCRVEQIATYSTKVSIALFDHFCTDGRVFFLNGYAFSGVAQYNFSEATVNRDAPKQNPG